MGGIMRTHVGIDVNVKGLGVAFTCYDYGTFTEVYRLLDEHRDYLAGLGRYGIAVEYYPMVYTGRFVSLPFRLYIREFKYPWDYIEPILRIWVRAHRRGIRNWQRIYRPKFKRMGRRVKHIVPGRSIDYIAGWSIEPRETRRLLKKLFRSSGLKYRVGDEIAEELVFIIREYEAEWLERYKLAVKLMTSKVCHVISHLEEAVVKLEELRGIEEKYRECTKVGRMRWRYVTWLVCGGVSSGISVGLVNPRGTSSKCPICRSQLRTYGWEKKYCPMCRREWNRDAMAGVNISVKPVIEWLRRPEWRTPMKVKTRGGARMKTPTKDLMNTLGPAGYPGVTSWALPELPSGHHIEGL